MKSVFIFASGLLIGHVMGTLYGAAVQKSITLKTAS